MSLTSWSIPDFLGLFLYIYAHGCELREAATATSMLLRNRFRFGSKQPHILTLT